MRLKLSRVIMAALLASACFFLLGIYFWNSHSGNTAENSESNGQENTDQTARGVTLQSPLRVEPQHRRQYPHASSAASVMLDAQLFADTVKLLPPPGTPVAAVYDQLKDRASRGDVDANCRLGTELARCASLRAAESQIELLVKEAAFVSKGSPEETRRLAEIESLQAQVQPIKYLCDGLSAEVFAKPPWEYIYFAAARGDVPSILAFTVYPPMDSEHFTADIEAWKVFHTEAGRLLELAAMKGSPTAMFQLAWAYANYPVAGGSPIVPLDPVKAIAFALLARPYADEGSIDTINNLISSMKSSIGETGFISAQELATKLRAKIGEVGDFSDGDFVNSSIPAPSACGG